MDRTWVSVAGILVGVCGCVQADGERDGNGAVGATRALINGEDDRREVYTAQGVTLARARQSIVALIHPSNLQESASRGVVPTGGTLTEIQTVCPDEMFADQPAVAACSGVLIDDDLVLTAGSCLPMDEMGEADCDRYAYVFDYHFAGPEQVPDSLALDVYGCKVVVAREQRKLTDGTLQDFAVVQLDRKVDAKRKPVPIRTTPVMPSERVTVMGSPSGLPTKLDAGGVVQASPLPTTSHWFADTDTFGGSSGSPAFDARLDLAGILVAGDRDFDTDPKANCQRPRRTAPGDEGSGREQFMYVTPALDALCATEEGRARAVCASSVQAMQSSGGAGCSLGTGQGRTSSQGWLPLLIAFAALWRGRSGRAKACC